MNNGKKRPAPRRMSYPGMPKSDTDAARFFRGATALFCGAATSKSTIVHAEATAYIPVAAAEKALASRLAHRQARISAHLEEIRRLQNDTDLLGFGLNRTGRQTPEEE